jgi:integrase
VRDRARLGWAKAGLPPVTPHVARHTYATLMIAAGANEKTLATLMGHGSIAITLDRYGHLFRDALVQAGALGDAYLAKVHAKA